MAKPKGINQKAKYRAHSIRLARYADRVQSVYDTLSQEIAKEVLRTTYDGSKPFRFKDYPLTQKKIEEVQAEFVRDLRSVIYSGTSAEWKESNLVQDLLVDKVLKFYGSSARGKKRKVYYQTNSDALKAFQERKTNGMNLSQRLWNQSKNFKDEMEFCISSGIQKGTSAIALSKRLSKYLVDFPSLKQDYKEKYGKAVTCQDCEYRSIRLARSEINMAYRTAEQERWKQFDFVLGYEVKTTQNGRHKEDMCDELAGRYPKDFKFVGWHPNCMCYVVPILKTEEQFFNEEDVEPVSDTPEGFKKYLSANADRIEKAKENGILPYWYTDNSQYVSLSKKEDYPQFHKCKTKEEYKELIETLPFMKSATFEDCSFKNVERITAHMFELGAQYEIPVEYGGLEFATYFEYTGKGSSASLGSFDMFGKQRMTIASNSDKVIERNIVKQKKEMLKRQREMIETSEKNLAQRKKDLEEQLWMGEDDPWIKRERAWIAKSEEYIKSMKEDYEQKLNSFEPVLDTTARNLEDVINHEFGHFLNDNIRRHWDLYSDKVHDAVIKIEKALDYKTDHPKYIWEYDRHLLDKVAFEEGRHISFYASTEGKEYFAEAFAYFCKYGTSKNPLLDELFNALKK